MGQQLVRLKRYSEAIPPLQRAYDMLQEEEEELRETEEQAIMSVDEAGMWWVGRTGGERSHASP